MFNASVLGQVAIRQMHIQKTCFDLLVDAPSDHAHLRGISKTSRLAFDLVLLVGSVNEVMTRFTERNQVVRAVTACLPTLDMVDITISLSL